MNNINLLPKELSGDKNAVKYAHLLNKIALSLGGIFLLTLIVGGVFYFLSVNSLNNSKTKFEQTSARVANLQPTEASLVLIKDRLQKAEQILNSRTNEKNFALHRKLLELAPPEVTFSENQVEAAVSRLEVETRSSVNLVNLMAALTSGSNFNSIFIDELSFAPNLGYSIIFEIF